MAKTLFILDAYNLIYRMFYAIPEMYTRSGTPVNAIFGVAKFLRSLAEENPDAQLLVATDVGKSFRADMYTEYKGTRDRMPDNLRMQIDGVFDLFERAGIPILSKEGYEADDIIGSLAQTCSNKERMVVIISSDKDLCQFVQDGCVHIYDAMKRKFMKRADVIEKFGVPPEQVRDYLAIVGDVSDNIPWISGFWPKKAKDLLDTYQSIENIYASIGVTQKWSEFAFNSLEYEKSDFSEKMKKSLLDQKENAFLSKSLATIITDLDVVYAPSESLVSLLQKEAYIALLQEYEFRSLVPKTQTDKRLEVPVIPLLSDESYYAFLAQITKHQYPLALRVDSSHVLWIATPDSVYSLDTKQIDASEFVDMCLSHRIPLIAYQMKLLWHQLVSIRRQTSRENRDIQASLF